MAYPGLDVHKLIGRDKMKESKFYQELLHEGRVEGREEGRVKGREEGEQNHAQHLIHRILKDKFGPIPDQLSRELNSIPEVAKLDDLVIAAFNSPSLDAFRNELPARPSRRKK